MLIDENRLKADICRESFFEFFKEFWSEMSREELVLNWHIKYLCDEMQIIAERVFRGEPKEYDLIVNISPGTSKSSIFSRAFPIWMWLRMPHAVSICASYSASLSEDLSRSSRDIVRSEKFKMLFPEIEIRRDRDGVQAFKNTIGGERKAVGVGGSIIGSHADIILIDDPLSAQASDSEAERRKADIWMNETISTRKKNKLITPTILIMQRLHQSDSTATMLKRKDIKHICLPAKLSDDVKPKKLRRFYKDGLFDPVRISQKALDMALDDLHDFGFQCQFMQVPKAREAGMFKIGRLKYVDDPLRLSHYKKVVISIDKAGSHESGCYTACVVMAKDQSDGFWILDVDRFQLDAFDRDERIKQIANRYGKDVDIVIEQEGSSGGKQSAQFSVRDLAGWNISIVNPSRKKEARADPFASQVNAGNVTIVRGNWNSAYKDELEYFPYSNYKDQVDASSQAFDYLVDDQKFYGIL